MITSDEMRVRDGIVVSNLNNAVSNEKGYGIYRRSAEPECPGLTTVYNNHTFGYPDLVISGTLDTTYAQHCWLLNFLCSYMMEEQPIEPAESYVSLLNQYLTEMCLNMSYQAVLINTDQFFNGYGFNSRRYYESGGVDTSEVVVIQLVEMDAITGCFPAISTKSQILFATTPFGKKEPVNANLPPVQNFASNRSQRNASYQ